jgi:hypothetical protein
VVNNRPTVVVAEEVDTNASIAPSSLVVVIDEDIGIVIGEDIAITRFTVLAVTGHDRSCSTASLIQPQIISFFHWAV